MEKKKEGVKKQPFSYGKLKLIGAKRYQGKRDILGALLEEEKSYTFKQVDEMVAKFLKKEVE